MIRNTVNAREVIGVGFPPEEGTKLADNLLAREKLDWEELEITLRGCAPGLLISAFFNGFLQRIADQKPDLLNHARTIQWTVDYPFQKENVSRWMHDFKPHNDNGQES